MLTCVYDNPSTMAREIWQDGALVAHMQAHVFSLPISQRPTKVHMGMNSLGAFTPGQHAGDLNAIAASTKEQAK